MSTVLASAVTDLARLLVPFLADLGAVTVLDDQDRPARTEIAWANPGGHTVSHDSVSGAPAHPALRDAIRQAAMSQKPIQLPAAGSAAHVPVESAAETDRQRDRYGHLCSALVLPICARGKTLGTLTLAMISHGQRRDRIDHALAEDLAARAAAAMDNARLYRQIQDRDRRKNEFLAMLAHELRNPLAPIRNAIEIVRALDVKDPELTWAGEVISRQVESMVRLVDDLLDMSRIAGGKIQLQKEEIDVASVVSRAVEISRPLIDARKHSLTVTLPEERILVDGDPVRLAQVIANLLNNAAKYTGEGGRIDLRVGREANLAVFRVRDSGIGIPAEMLTNVFDLFTQVDQSLDRSQGGLGIGLTLVRRLVEMHGGTVEVSSEGPDRGSEFTIRLPAFAETTPTAPIRGNGAIPLPAQGASCRILVVDDNEDSARTLAKLLRQQGHDVSVAHDGPSAVESASALLPDVVLLDIGLPGLNGYDVARRIREDCRENHPFLVAITGYGQDSDRHRSREAGFDSHLIKPVDLDQLRRLLISRAETRAAPVGS
jgi:signal transduction histidine kinase/ActR/RegA family two-component response regulator